MKPFDEIHAFWFEGVTDETLIRKNENPFRKWFLSDKDFDRDVKEKFGRCFADERLAREAKNPRERLSLIILFDQLSRNMFRDTPQAYAYDEAACLLAERMIEEGQDRQLMAIERLFVYMPLMHAENAQRQDLSVRCFTALAEDVQRDHPGNYVYYKSNLKHAARYREIIAAYDRFPHRDKILGRDAR